MEHSSIFEEGLMCYTSAEIFLLLSMELKNLSLFYRISDMGVCVIDKLINAHSAVANQAYSKFALQSLIKLLAKIFTYTSAFTHKSQQNSTPFRTNLMRIDKFLENLPNLPQETNFILIHSSLTCGI